MTDAEKKAIVDAVKGVEASIKARITDRDQLAETLYDVGDLLQDIYLNDDATGLDYPDEFI